MEVFDVFHNSFLALTQGNVKTYHVDNPSQFEIASAKMEEKAPTPVDPTAEKTPQLTCSSCKVDFASATEQRIHFKLDWHRYNLKQKLKGKQCISEACYNEQIDDLSSTSGDSSGSGDEEETLNSVATAQGKVFLQKDDGTVFSLYKCLLGVKKEEITNETLMGKLKSLHANKQWTILMLGGGHFAGAVFLNGEPILHKTFHCYTVRAGQGGSQSSKDNRSASQPKSAGASLRRYNEGALIQHVKDIVETWQKEIEKSGLILYRASGPYNRSVLFGGKTPLLERNDQRLRTIPFSTKRANFSELKRVYTQLSEVTSYKNVEEASTKVIRQRSPVKEPKKSKSSSINRAKSRELTKREIPGADVVKMNENDSSCEDDVNFELDESEISFESLKEYDDSLRIGKKQKKKNNSELNNRVKAELANSELTIPQIVNKLTNSSNSTKEEAIACDNKKEKKPKKSKTQKQREKLEASRKLLCEIIASTDTLKLTDYITGQIAEKQAASSEDNVVEVDEPSFYSQVVDDKDNTLLHYASTNKCLEMIRYLLVKDADPCKKNKALQTPYTCTQDKDVREVFKQYALEYPEKHNYNKAHIPIATTPTEEALEKKRLRQKAKREKEKEKKKENAIKKKEEEAEDRFAKMTDREKCALAAERRILNLGGKVILRCFKCGKDMSGLVPFTYNEYKFCTVDCLKAHRMQSVTL